MNESQQLEQIIRILHKIHHAIMANGQVTDFSREDEIVRGMTKDIEDARKRIPTPEQQQTTKG